MAIVDSEMRIRQLKGVRQSDEAKARRAAAALWVSIRRRKDPRIRRVVAAFHNDGNLFEAVAANRILRSEQIPFCAFWGVGGKEKPDNSDAELLDDLTTLRDAIPSPDASLQLLLADAHGRFNGFTDSHLAYLDDIEAAATTRGIATVRLSVLYEQWGIELPKPGEPIPQDPSSSRFISFWENPEFEMQRQQLEQAAYKHNRTAAAPELAAYNYTVMRLQEGPYLEQTYPNSVLLANTDKRLGELLLPPKMPHFYLHKPPSWFNGVN